jgi:hypothetical protein
MNLRTRLQKVEAAASTLRRRPKMISCEDMDWDEFSQRVCDAMDEADDDILQHIPDHMEERSKTPRRDYACWNEPLRDENGQIIYELHFFLIWLIGLKNGWFNLPARVPGLLLETLDRDHGCISFRCRDCRCGIGNAVILAECPSAEASWRHRAWPATRLTGRAKRNIRHASAAASDPGSDEAPHEHSRSHAKA